MKLDSTSRSTHHQSTWCATPRCRRRHRRPCTPRRRPTRALRLLRPKRCVAPCVIRARSLRTTHFTVQKSEHARPDGGLTPTQPSPHPAALSVAAVTVAAAAPFVLDATLAAATLASASLAGETLTTTLAATALAAASTAAALAGTHAPPSPQPLTPTLTPTKTSRAVATSMPRLGAARLRLLPSESSWTGWKSLHSSPLLSLRGSARRAPTCTPHAQLELDCRARKPDPRLTQIPTLTLTSTLTLPLPLHPSLTRREVGVV